MCQTTMPPVDAPLEMRRCQGVQKNGCTNRASGIYAVTTKFFAGTRTKEMYLCAACGFGIHQRRRIFVPKDSTTPVCYRDVVSVSLQRSI